MVSGLTKRLKAAVGTSLKSENTLAQEREVFELRQKGYSVKEIADLINMSVRYVQVKISDYRRRRLRDFVKEDRRSILLDSTDFLLTVREAAMMEIEAIREGAAQEKRSLEDSERRTLDRLLRTATTAQKDRQDLMVTVGILPRAASEIHMTVGGTQPRIRDEVDPRQAVALTRDEMISTINEYLGVSSNILDVEYAKVEE